MSSGPLEVLRAVVRTVPRCGCIEQQYGGVHEALAQVEALVLLLRDAREWHRGDKWRNGEPHMRAAWLVMMDRYDAALAALSQEPQA